MKIICAWCGNDLGEKAPYENNETTHGICPKCMATLKLQEKQGDDSPRGQNSHRQEGCPWVTQTGE